MRATILVEIDTEGSTDLLLLADDVKEACEKDGITVVEAKPWARQQLVLPATLSEPSGSATVPSV